MRRENGAVVAERLNPNLTKELGGDRPKRQKTFFLMEKPLGKMQRRYSKSGLLLGIAGPNHNQKGKAEILPTAPHNFFFASPPGRGLCQKLVQKKNGELGFLKFDDNGMHIITLPKAPISSATTTNEGHHVGETPFPFPALAQKRKEYIGG